LGREEVIADDLFAGAGGWDLAAQALGIHARGIENMPEARLTRDAAGLTTIHDDVWTYRPKYQARHSGLTLQAQGLIASPPCQTFSAAGKGAGRKALDDVLALIPSVPEMSLQELRDAASTLGDDERTALVLTPLWFAIHHPYRWLAWEQVPQVLPVWEACADVLRTLGWNTWTGYLFSEQYGVPQTRKRAFLLADYVREVDRPEPTHSRYHSRNPDKLDVGVEKWVSMAEALGWADDDVMVSNYGTGGDPRNRGRHTGLQPAPAVTSKIDRNVVLRNNNTANAAVRPIDAPAPTLYFGQRSNYCAWEYAVGARATGAGTPRPIDAPAPTVTSKGTFYWLPTLEDYVGPRPAIEGERGEDITWPYNRPSPTIVGSYHPEVVAAPGYRKAGDPPRQKTPGSVRITLAEAAVLQSFPADFPFNGGPKDAQGKKFLQVGNAVPPLMALHALSVASGIAIPATVAEENVA
jgi:DNA (cytosine-5)-methyltransferase 1